MKTTINLMPPEKKENFEVAKKLEAIIKIFSLIFLALFVFAGFLLACLAIINFQISTFKNQEETLTQNEIYQRMIDTQNMIEKYHKQVVFLDGEYARGQSFIYLLENLNSSLGGDIYLKNLSINDGKMVIQGFALNRESLLKFKNKLESIEGMIKVDTPISNFVSSENIDFEFSVIFDNQES